VHALVGCDVEWSGAKSEGAQREADQLSSARLASFRQPISQSQRQRSSIVSHIAAATALLQRRPAAISMLTQLTGARDHRCLLLSALLAADQTHAPSHAASLPPSAPQLTDRVSSLHPLSQQ